MSAQGGISDWMILNQTRPRGITAPGGGNAGFATLGAALGGGLQTGGAMAYQRGMTMGAQTADALAQARQRVMENSGRDDAANALGDPNVQNAMGLTPDQAVEFQAQVRAGTPFQNIVSAYQGLQKMKLGDRLSDPNADPAARHAAAFALAPQTAAPKAEGPYGSTFDPLANGGAGVTSVGDQQAAIGRSMVTRNQDEGQAALTRAAHEPAAANGGVDNHGQPLKPPHGMQWAWDPTSGDFKRGPDGLKIAEPIPGVPQPVPGGAVNERYNRVVLQSAETLAADSENIAKMGFDSTRGAMGTPAHEGLLGTLTNNLTKVLSSTDQQQYNTTVNNIGRALAYIEQQGRSPNQATIRQLDSIVNDPGNTAQSRLYNLALMRQIAENGQRTINSETEDPNVKKAYNDAVARIQKAIPFEPGDVLDFERHGGTMAFGDFLKSRQGTPAAPGAAPGALPPGLKLVN